MSLFEREVSRSAIRSIGQRTCIVAVCIDSGVAETIGREAAKLNRVCLVTYHRAEDLVSNSPAGQVALVILANQDTPATLDRVLIWLRHRWPHCPVAVVNHPQGGPDYEMTARRSGALFLTPPVEAEAWSSLMTHLLRPKHGNRRIRGSRLPLLAQGQADASQEA